MTDEKGNAVVVSAVDNHWAERFVRSALTEMGGAAFLALMPMTGAQLRRAAVRGSISQAWRTGQAWLDARAQHHNPIVELRRVTGGFHLFSGKLSDVQRTMSGGFCRGHAQIDGLDGDSGRSVRLHFQNEFLLAESQGEVLASTPDLIVTVDLETGEPITAEQARFGLRVAVLGIPCVADWRTPAALALVGPGRFGYAVDYRPIEQLALDR